MIPRRGSMLGSQGRMKHDVAVTIPVRTLAERGSHDGAGKARRTRSSTSYESAETGQVPIRRSESVSFMPVHRARPAPTMLSTIELNSDFIRRSLTISL
ncbi:hypothetical protein BD310DRAFT_614492 [Dichomitus squalens]|uniref:Uncharacterized protein n=1 Tax=Dichomitus squalens TaxID=114155 RepID=A0A4Q9PPW0_9APHY|nr:hypothetical protein BD310DRAFT_614492 [Dichomitus squalens]